MVTKLTSEYHEVLSGLNKQKSIKAKLEAQKAATEEQRLQELGIIEAEPDSQPTTWCASLVYHLVYRPKGPQPGGYTFLL